MFLSHRHFQNLLLLCIVHLGIVHALAAQEAFDLIRAGDRRADGFEHQAALAQYKLAYQADSSNCTALWKIAETCINIGEESNETVQRQYYYAAEKWALRALEQCPDEPNAHFFVAVSSGLLALYEGGKSKISRSVTVKEQAEQTLALDPNHHGAYHVLGRWHRELANVGWVLKALAKLLYGGVPPGASNEAAVENFKKAIAISPQWIVHYKELGLTYMAMKRWREARQAFEAVLELPVQDHQDEFHKRRAREFLAELQGKVEK